MEDKDREKRRVSALLFCRNVTMFAIVTGICATIFALFMNNWDTSILSSRTMLIIYGIEVILISGAFHVAIFGWQEK